MTLEQEARQLYARRDVVAAELARIDTDLRALRLQYMIANKTYGILPANFRREVETIRETA